MTPLQTLQRLRPTYPTPMSEDQLAALLNETAWIHRAEGYGLLMKPTGAHCQQPITGTSMSHDILMLASGEIFDCLIDAEGKAIPTWGPKRPVDPARFLIPVPPGVGTTPGEPPPVTPPPATAVIPYNEAYAVQFGEGCNDVYLESGATFDPGMISVHSQRAAYDYYVGGMRWDASYKKHLNAFRHEYGLPPL